MNADNAVLLVVDIQGKLAQLMHNAQRVHKVAAKAIEVAKIFNIPILLSEQAPDKIGSTIPAIASLLTGQQPIIKQTFSCYGQPEFVKQLNSLQRHHIIVVGIESHVCVYQTVRDLLRHGYAVDVVADGVGARDEFNHRLGLERMGKEGASITTAEMLFCDLLVSAQDPRFKMVMSIFKR